MRWLKARLAPTFFRIYNLIFSAQKPQSLGSEAPLICLAPLVRFAPKSGLSIAVAERPLSANSYRFATTHEWSKNARSRHRTGG